MKLFGLQEAGLTIKRELIMPTAETTATHREDGSRAHKLRNRPPGVGITLATAPSAP